MKKIIILFAIFLIGVNGFCQKKKFKAGAKIVETEIFSQTDSIYSILFIFKGDTHLINYYLDLNKYLQKRFRKYGSEINFNFELSSNTPLKSDLESIPKKRKLYNDFDLICQISISFDEDSISKEYLIELENSKISGKGITTVPQLSHNLHLTLKKVNTQEI